MKQFLSFVGSLFPVTLITGALGPIRIRYLKPYWRCGVSFFYHFFHHG